ncbi:molybdopterin converting factor subunit 1 [Marinibactrum halimedae]|uniref:Molybdopterin synthase sulfur carrier subunit n=1 Tax=Marinibactrum halimedae TaxID=1444977 RepID=A0AA37T1W9_9GAMM|nr:molybdopterin converting factor subunit 1 [Marinibactrum halimedae]MCD9459885.1 molybdopterin converting factor subunit 1 [Marinibactrum halimedae]GLS25259.1 molybdopterin synthase sulfur carrier subunit [Marinibactrum halimedae]
MIKVLFFASLRDKLGVSELAVSIDQLTAISHETSVEVLVKHLSSQNAQWGDILNSDASLLIAINQTMVESNTVIHDGDEVALFPPVTGG